MTHRGEDDRTGQYAESQSTTAVRASCLRSPSGPSSQSFHFCVTSNSSSSYHISQYYILHPLHATMSATFFHSLYCFFSVLPHVYFFPPDSSSSQPAMTATIPGSGASGLHPAGPPPVNYAASITSLITRRQAQLDYLQRVHNGKTLYLNSTHLTPNTIPTTLPPKHTRQRIIHYLLLGLSLGRLVAVTDASLLLYSLSALLDEFGHFVSHPSADAYYFQPDTIHHTLHVPLFALTHPPSPGFSYPVRVHRQTLYTYLLLPTSLSASPSTSTAQSLSYASLLSSLLSLLSHHYTALLALPATAASYAYVTAMDRRLMAVIVAPLLADFTAASIHAVKAAVDGLKGSAVKADTAEWVKVASGSGGGGASAAGGVGLGSVDFGAISAMTSVFNAGAMSTTSDSETIATDANLPPL